MLLFRLTSTVSTPYIDYHIQEHVNCPGQRKSDTSIASVVKYSTYPKTPYTVSTIIILLDVHVYTNTMSYIMQSRSVMFIPVLTNMNKSHGRLKPGI